MILHRFEELQAINQAGAIKNHHVNEMIEELDSLREKLRTATIYLKCQDCIHDQGSTSVYPCSECCQQAGDPTMESFWCPDEDMLEYYDLDEDRF